MSKTKTIVGVEAGMLACVATAFVLLPESTPLRTFVGLSVRCFLVGNVVLVARLKQGKSAHQSPNDEVSSRIWNAFAMLAISGLIASFFVGH
jgi:hypothetical protein